MPNCQQIDPLVTPYVDRELADAERRIVDDHLRRCPPCHSRVAAEQAVHALLDSRRPELRQTCAPPALRSACEAICHGGVGLAGRTAAGGTKARRVEAPISNALGTNAPSTAAPGTAAPGTAAPGTTAPSTAAPSTAAPFSWLAPFAMAASLVVVVGGAFLYQATRLSTRVLAAELAADHVKCFAMNAALGTHQAKASVESAMLSSFAWQMHLPEDAEGSGLELVGARPCVYGEGKIAHIMYRHEGRAMSLFMLPGTTRPKELVEVLGHQAAIWCVNNRTFVLVSREPRSDVERLASIVQASLH